MLTTALGSYRDPVGPGGLGQNHYDTLTSISEAGCCPPEDRSPQTSAASLTDNSVPECVDIPQNGLVYYPNKFGGGSIQRCTHSGREGGSKSPDVCPSCETRSQLEELSELCIRLFIK